VKRLLPWLTLKEVPGIGNLIYKRLIDRFHTPERVFQASEVELTAVNGVSKRIAKSLRSSKPSDQAQQGLALASRRGYGIVTLNDNAYPPLLRQIPDPPPFLYVAGRLTRQSNTIAVVGARHATRYGHRAAMRLAGELGQSGFTVVSGMALGIDTAAHEGALRSGARSVAVLGSGLEKIYPKQNRKLFDQIAARGAVISEFELTAEPEAHHFPIRNRVISGMSRGTLVVEATPNSGSLITANLAAEQNREVFAVPGSIGSYKSRGCHDLIKQGAKLVETANDILEEFTYSPQPPAKASATPPLKAAAASGDLSSDEKRIIDTLDAYPIHIDELGRQLHVAPHRLAGLLLQLEVKGLIQQVPGNRYYIEDQT
jgi:DNA processing protein